LFVRVRLTRIAGADLRLFEFDHDLTWYVFFANVDESIYGRYGGRDATGPDARISLKGLRFAMDRALEWHKNPPPAVKKEGKPLRAEDFASAKRHSGCIHCHNVNEFERADQVAAKTWSRDNIWVYPLPENVGITLDVDVGNKVKAIEKASAAERVGLRIGDAIHSLNGVRIASFGDAIYALHIAPKSGNIAIVWEREGKKHQAELEVKAGWRKTNVTWRPSLLDLLPSVPFSGEELTDDERKTLRLPADQAAFRQDKFVHSTLKAVGIQKDDVIVGVDGRTEKGGMRELLGYIRRNYLAGDEIQIAILREGKPLQVKLILK